MFKSILSTLMLITCPMFGLISCSVDQNTTSPAPLSAAANPVDDTWKPQTPQLLASENGQVLSYSLDVIAALSPTSVFEFSLIDIKEIQIKTECQYGQQVFKQSLTAPNDTPLQQYISLSRVLPLDVLLQYQSLPEGIVCDIRVELKNKIGSRMAYHYKKLNFKNLGDGVSLIKTNSDWSFLPAVPDFNYLDKTLQLLPERLPARGTLHLSCHHFKVSQEYSSPVADLAKQLARGAINGHTIEASGDLDPRMKSRLQNCRFIAIGTMQERVVGQAFELQFTPMGLTFSTAQILDNYIQPKIFGVGVFNVSVQNPTQTTQSFKLTLSHTASLQPILFDERMQFFEEKPQRLNLVWQKHGSGSVFYEGADPIVTLGPQESVMLIAYGNSPLSCLEYARDNRINSGYHDYSLSGFKIKAEKPMQIESYFHTAQVAGEAREVLQRHAVQVLEWAPWRTKNGAQRLPEYAPHSLPSPITPLGPVQILCNL